MNWRRLGIVAGVTVALSGGLGAFLLRQQNARAEKARKAASRVPVWRPTPTPPRPWRWATEGEWVVHQVVLGLASWTNSPGGADDDTTRISVRRVQASPEPGVFEVELGGKRGSRKVEVRPAAHVWDPSAYVAVALDLLGGESGFAAGPRVAELDRLLLESDTASLRRADIALSGELLPRSRDATLHDHAALLWAAHALRESDGDYADDRPFLNGVTTHLALATALGGTRPPTADGMTAAAALDTLLYRQTEAVATLDRLTATKPGRAAEAWGSALRFRITRDPRRIRPDARFSRLEQLEGLRAIDGARSCRAATEQARTWRLAFAADWLRGMVEHCAEPEHSQLAADYSELQTADALRMVDRHPDTLETTLRTLEQLSARNTHVPTRPASVVPEYVRADAGVRHVLSSLTLIVRDLRRQGRRDAVKALALATNSLTADLPQRPLLEITLDRASEMSVDPGRKPHRTTCDRLARLVTDRPDLVLTSQWGYAADCAGANLLRVARDDRDWRGMVVVSGTARFSRGPWQTGPVAGRDALAEAARHAPWAPLVARSVVRTYGGNAPGSVVTKAFGSLLEYDRWSMQAAVAEIQDDDDTVQRLAERICEVNVELCASYADYLALLGRPAAAEPLWRRALAGGARDSIALSNHVGGYVNLLLNRGNVRDAVRIAERAANVYSAGGLATLAFARERLGEFDEAARLYASISERYENMTQENRFYLRYRQRHGGDRFAEKARLAEAEVFPHGLVRKSREDFQREGHRGGIVLDPTTATAPLRRFGLRPLDSIVAFDDYAVGNWDQMNVVTSFTDAPIARVVVYRHATGYVALTGAYPRWNYDPLPGRTAKRRQSR